MHPEGWVRNPQGWIRPLGSWVKPFGRFIRPHGGWIRLPGGWVRPPGLLGEIISREAGPEGGRSPVEHRGNLYVCTYVRQSVQTFFSPLAKAAQKLAWASKGLEALSGVPVEGLSYPGSDLAYQILVWIFIGLCKPSRA